MTAIDDPEHYRFERGGKCIPSKTAIDVAWFNILRGKALATSRIAEIAARTARVAENHGSRIKPRLKPGLVKHVTPTGARNNARHQNPRNTEK